MVFKVQKVGGDERNRTADPLLARQVLSQLSYAPTFLLLSAKTCLVGLSGLEPLTSRLSGVRSNQLSYKPILKSFDFSGDEEIRTLDPLLARQVLSQLSYTPMMIWHPPALPCRLQHSTIGRLSLNHRVRDGYGCFP